MRQQELRDGWGFNEAEIGRHRRGEVQAGIKNARRLLPLAKQLTLEALRETGAVYRGVRRGRSRGRGVLTPCAGSCSIRGWAARARAGRPPPRYSRRRRYALHLTSDDEGFSCSRMINTRRHLVGQVARLRRGPGARCQFTATWPDRPQKKTSLRIHRPGGGQRFVELNPTEVRRLNVCLAYSGMSRPPSVYGWRGKTFACRTTAARL